MLIAGFITDTASANDPRRELLRIRLTIERELRNSPDMLDALKNVADARLEYGEHRKIALSRLEMDSDYRRARVEADEVQAKLDAVYHQYRYGVAPQNVTHPLARQILDLRGVMSNREHEALIQDIATQETRAIFLDAARAVIELRRRIPQAIRNDPRFRHALEQMKL